MILLCLNMILMRLSILSRHHGSGSTFDGLPTALWIQFTYTTNNGAINITGYLGTYEDVSIPSTINGLPVTSIGDFDFMTYLTSVTDS